MSFLPTNNIPLLVLNIALFPLDLSSGTMKSVNITSTSRTLPHVQVTSLKSFGQEAGNSGLVTPWERMPNFPDMSASTLLDGTVPLVTTLERKDWRLTSREGVSATLTAKEGPKHPPLLLSP